MRALSWAVRALAVAVSSFAARLAVAHEAGAPFSGAILDPLVLHHAHIENEQRVNLAATRESGAGGGLRPWRFDSELELSWATRSYDFGVEAFIPFSNVPVPGDGRATGVGDIALRPIKWSPWMTRELVLTFAAEVDLPTGNATKYLGTGNTSAGGLVFVDSAFGNWFLGFNAGVMTNVHGARGSEAEYGVAASYSFIDETSERGIAPAVPSQTLVFAPSLEVIAESPLAGAGAGEMALRLLPGLSFWFPRSGMQLRIGVARPVYGALARDEWAFMLQVGNHRRWTNLFSTPADAGHDQHGM